MSTEPLKVLICDDSMLVKRQLKQILKDAGVETIFEASNGKEALAIINKYKPQVMFLDIVMPVMDGIDTLKNIKKKKYNITVVMISSSGTQANLKKAFELGAYDFILKPWKEAEIAALLDKIRQRGGT
ncbi:MAG: response regulator transcription factor [Peptococcia bacterium]|jgi:two-component system chemotaxis response regulator CheY